MPSQTHHVRALTLKAEVDGTGLAFAIRSRLEELMRGRVPALLAAAFDARVPPDVHIRMDRLELKLGVLPAQGLEEALLAALERAVGEALDALLVQPDGGLPGGPEVRRVPAGAVPQEVLEHFLTRGTLPFWAGRAVALPALLAEVADAQPAGLRALLLRLGRDRRALERLVLQAGEDMLRRLLALLTPDEAAAILAYLADMALAHAARPLAAPGDGAMRRLLWLLTFEFLTREAGSQFNRRRYLESLLRGIAEGEGVAFDRLLALLAAGVHELRRRGPLGSSLPSVVGELLAERGMDGAGEDAGASGAEGDGPRLVAALRRRAGNRGAVAALLRPLPPAAFAGVVETLEPVHAGLVLAYLDDLALLHRQQALLALSEEGFGRLTRLLAVLHLLRDAGSRFNRRDYLDRLLRGLAEEEGVDYGRLLGLLADGLALAAGRHTLSASLPGLVAELVAEQAADRGPVQVARGDPPAAPAREPDGALLEGMLAAGAAAGDGVALAPRLEALARSDPGALARLVRRLAADRRALQRLVAALPVPALEGLLAALDREHAALVLAYLADLARLHRSNALLSLDETGFARLTWGLAIGYVAAEPGSQFNRRSLLRRLIGGIARHDGLEERRILTALRLGLERLAVHRPPAGSLPAVLDELLEEMAAETGGSEAAGILAAAERYLAGGGGAGALAAAARHDPAGLAALLRRLAAGDALPDRLFAVLLPDEVAALLAPGREEEAGRWAEALAAVPGGGTASAWRAVLDLLLADAALPPPPRGRGRWALLAHWLEREDAAWPEPLAAALVRLLEDLPDTVPAALAGRAFPPGRLEARLRPLLAALGGEAGGTLLRRLAPDDGLPPRAAPDEGRRRLLAWLSGDLPDVGAADEEELLALLEELAGGDDPELGEALRRGLAEERVRRRWAAALPEAALTRLLAVLAPDRAAFLLSLAACLGAACAEASPGSGAGPRRTWAALLDALAASSPGEAPRRLAGRLAAAVAGGEKPAARTLLERARDRAAASGEIAVRAVLEPPPPPAPQRPGTGRARFALDGGAEVPVGETFHVANAGLVLLNPFLPRFFQMLGVLEDGPDGRPRMAGVDAASRAVHLLQHIAELRCDRPEPELLLNKLLCGLAPETPVAASIVPTDAECSACDQVVRAVIANWQIIRGTSPQGLRETFLNREGKLVMTEAGWKLLVQRKTVDVLVDQVGWSLSMVFHRWMPQPLHVTW